MTHKNIQPADSATAGSDPSAANPQKIRANEWRAFYSAYLTATPQARRMVCHLIQAHAAGADRRVVACAYHWAAFIAIDPPAAYRVTPTLRRVVHGVCIGLGLALLLSLMTACSGSDGSGAASFRATAQAAGVVSVGNNAETTQPATPTPTDQPAQISPTETPDMQPAQIEAPAQVVEVTRIVEVTQPAQVVEVTRIVEVVTTPTPDIAGFQAGIDESVQPCPIKFWKRGRCTATQAQLERAASEMKP